MNLAPVGLTREQVVIGVREFNVGDYTKAEYFCHNLKLPSPENFTRPPSDHH